MATAISRDETTIQYDVTEWLRSLILHAEIENWPGLGHRPLLVERDHFVAGFDDF